MTRSRGEKIVPWIDPPSLRKASTSSSLSSAAFTWLKFLLQLGVTVALARALGPESYGVAAIVIAIGGAAELLKESGFSLYVAQRRDLTYSQLNAVFSVSVACGLSLGALMSIAGPLLAVLLDDRSYILYSFLQAPAFLFASIAAIPNGMLTRQFKFREIASSELLSAIAASVAALSIVYFAPGPLAMVLQTPVYMVLLSCLTLFRARWLPRGPADLSIARAAFSYGSNASYVQLLYYSSRNVGAIIAGVAFGPSVTAFYTQASQLLLLPLQQVCSPIQRVAIPLLRRVRDDPDRLRYGYIECVRVITLVLFPFFAISGVYAQQIILVVFGADWLPAARLFSVLAIAGCGQAAAYGTVWIFASTEQFRRQAVWVTISQVLLAAGFAVGSLYGPVWFVAGYSLVLVSVVLPGYLIATQRTGLQLRDLGSAVKIPSLVGLFALLVSLAAQGLIPPSSAIVNLGQTAIVGFLTAVFSLAFPEPRRLVGSVGSSISGGARKYSSRGGAR